MNKRLSLVSLIAFLSASFMWPQVTSSLSVTAVPTIDIPIGVTLPGHDDISLYGLGYGVTVRGEYALPFARFLSAGLVIDADFVPPNTTGKWVTLLGGGAEVAATLYPIQRLGVRAGARGGLYAGFFEQQSFTQPYVAGSLDVGYLFTPSFNLDLGASYKVFFPYGVIYNGLGLSLGFQYRIGATKAVMKTMPLVRPIFPLFYSYYDKNPVGQIALSNVSASEMRKLSVSFFVRQFMEQPKECWTADSLAAGKKVDAPIYALFKDSIFGVTEGTKVAGEILVSYEYLGKPIKESVPVTVTINNRNGMTWDDTRKVAAFVTSMDSSVRSFSLPVAAMSRTRGNQAVNAAFRAAMAIFDALKAQGLGYVSDPVAPFETKSANKEVVDYLQFPVQTLAFKGGDCDDLSIVYAALLESAGVGTAFITIPGHIYMAFDLGMRAEEAKDFFNNTNTLIVREGEAWLPVEVTRVQDGFVRAYQTGVQEWLTAEKSGKAGFYPISEAWTEYPPANTGEIVKVAPSLPTVQSVGSLYDAEIQRFYIAEFQPRIDASKADIAKAKGLDLLRKRNRLGILYARFGMLDEARKQFEAIVAADEGGSGKVAVAALINLGNIAYLSSIFDKAADFYDRALKLQPDNAAALLGSARANYELGKGAKATSSLEKLRVVSPVEAEKYAYIGGASTSGRAASADKELSSWSDE
jgi:tetratricopeptide (TPR) repeat protein